VVWMERISVSVWTKRGGLDKIYLSDSLEHTKNLNVWYTYEMFEASAIEEVQRQENATWENLKGASNEQGAMIDDIGLNIKNSCCNCTDKILPCLSIKNSKEPSFP
ncbi:hypothetical protein Tco_1413909, partial [Tanacetum coccineum]